MSAPSSPDDDAADATISKVHFCPACKKPLRRIDGKMGPFWGCTGFPLCKNTLYDRDGKPSTDANEQYRCPVCTRPMVRTSNKRGIYWFCTGYKKGCKVRLNDDQGKPEISYRCRHCGQLLVQRKGKKGMFWGCSRYPECTETYNDKDGKPDFDFLAT